MKTNLLLNQSRFIPDFTSKRPRPDSVSSPCRCRVLAILLLCLTFGIGQMWGAVGGTLKTYDTNSSTFSNGYASQAGDNFVWYGQKNYFGANNATTHGKIKPAAANLPVVKAQNASATTTTTGYYWCYTSEAVSNVGAVQITFSAKSGSSTVKAYVVSSSTAASSGSATWTELTLLTGSPYAQGANVCNSGTYTFTFPKETSAKYYGIVFVTSSYWRATGFQMKLLEGCTAPTAVTKGTVTSSSFGLTITDAQNAGNYDIYFSTSSTAPTADLAAGSFTTVNTKTPTVSSGVAASTTYYVWVRSSKTVNSVTYKSAWVALTGNTLTTPSAASCTADPTIGAASLNGSFNSGGVTSLTNTVSFSTTSCDPKTNCEWQDYGFVWGTSASPTVSNTKMQKGTSGDATSWDMTSPSTFTVDNTYKVRAYGKNGKTGAAFVYSSSDLSFTPRSVAFNPNGGSAVATKYIKSGGAMTAPTAPTKTGYNFDSWRTDAGLGTAVSWPSTINSSTTYYAKWNAKTYAITLNANTGAGSSPASVNATYNAHALSSAITNPTKTDYIFEGWNTKADGSGLTVIGTDGELISDVSGYTDASGNWTKDGTETLYAKWTEHTYTNYRTKCCDDLGAIDGEATLTQGGNSVTISGWSDVANVGTYTVKLYKKNGASWDLVSGSTSGGSAGTQGTRTGITSGSKSVTYTGLVVESEYKFTIQAIAGSAAYCDGVETAVTEINSTDVSSTPFKFRYSIYIDNGSNSGWAHHYIEPTGNTDEGSIDITLAGPVDYYQFKIGGGFSGWWGQTGESKYTTGGTQWTLDGSQNVKMQTWIGGTYTFTVDYSGTTNPKVTITYPSANQDAGNIVYWDASVVANWDHLHFRVGTDGNANAGSDCKTDLQKVPGTDNFYKVTTASFTGMRVWAIANNTGWTGSNTNGVYKTNTGDGYAVTLSSEYQDYVVGDDGVTLVPYGSGTMGTYSHDNNCRFYTVTKTDGMLTHNVSLNSPAHGTLLVTYTNTSGTTGQTVTEGNNADLAHRCILTITATPDDGYTCSSLTVNSADFTSGNTHILSDDATIEATFTAQTSTVTLDNNDATSGSQQTVTATYDAAMPLKTTAVGTPAVAALTRTGYTFNGWWDAISGGTQYYTYSGSPKVIASARTWNKTGAQTLKAQWTVNQYTLTWDLQGGTVATAGTGAAAAATGTPSSSQDYGTSLKAPVVTKTGYNFNVWSPSVAGTMPAENTTYTATWTAQVYNITYKDQGDNAYSGNATAGVPTGAPTTHTYGSATALVNGVKDGYRFDGWFTDASCTVSAGSSIGATAVTADFTLYAKWTQIYTVTWHVNGSTYNTGVVDGNSHVVSGGKISAPPTAPADNTLSACADKFMGWSAKNGGSDAKTTSYYDDLFTDVAGSPYITSNKDFYAVFADVPDEIYWSMGTIDQLSSGSGYSTYDGVHTVTGSDGNDYTYTSSNVMANSGNQFRGSSYCGRIYNTTSLGRITRIVLDYSAYAGQMKVYESDSEISSSGTTALTPTISDNTYTYECSGKGYFIVIQEGSNAAKANVTVYFGAAPSNYVTQCDPNQVRVSYDANGGSTTCAGGSHDKRNDYTVCSTPPTRDYYTFAGWLCSADDEVYAASATIDDAVIDADFSLTAQWTPVNYTITYNLHGGTTAGGNPTTYDVETATIDLADGTYGHNRFEGWYSTYNDGTGAYSDQVTSIPLGSHGDITLHAKWTTRHEIVFDADGETTTIYRADDENMEDAVAGQGSVPSDPSAPSTCSTKVFVGWSESEIDDETNTRPGDLMKPAEGKVDEDKHYYAVWALRAGSPAPATYAGTGTFVKITSMSEVETDTYYVLRGIKNSTIKVMKNTISSSKMGTADDPVSENVITNPGVAIVWKLGGTKNAYTLYNQSVSKYVEITANATSGYALNASPTAGATYTLTIEEGHGFFFKSNYSTASNRGISIYDASEFRSYLLASANTLELYKLPAYTYSAYSTSCCETKVNLTHNSTEHGTVEFNKSRIGTCNSDKEVSLTITPDAGYKLTGWTVNTASGYADAKTTSPAVVTNNNNSTVQNITLTFAQDANKDYDVTATFGLMTVSSWAWTLNSSAIADPLNLYVGQSARLDVAYTPAGVDASKKTYTRNKVDAYINWVGAQQATYSTISGKASTGENTTAVTFTHADGPTTTVNVKVLPLPAVHFGDIVHNVSFDDVVATLSDNTLSPTKTTPTHADFDGSTLNTCEEQHLHLVGWIREDWPALVAYLAGGAQPSTDDITGAGNDGSGNAYFFTPGASINTQTFNGVTFYAVWAKVE